ncbi:hypothetical protein BAY59_27180 [Prauserella coralliicola]|nr:hypothetical protein BAY59_27180 [Prauserella coralliicola]
MSDLAGELTALWSQSGGVAGVARSVNAGVLDADRLERAALAAVSARNPRLGALTTVFDPPIASSPSDTRALGLEGVPFVVKENMDVAGWTTHACARWLADGPSATRHADVIRTALTAGARLIGRGNMPELATAAVTVGDAFMSARTPIDPSRTAGGSSGGTAAAVAAGMALFGIGTDTGGSVTIPAAFTGLYGYRPTVGVYPTTGVVPFAATFDTPGLLCRTAADLAYVHAELAPHRAEAGNARNGQLRVAVVGGVFDRNLDPEVREGRDRLVDRLRAFGATIRSLDLPGSSELASAIRTVAWFEAARAWRGLVDARPGTSPSEGVALRIESGLAIPQDRYRSALAERARWILTVSQALTEVDVLLSPTVAVVPPRIDGLDTESATVEITRLSYPWCFAGLPSISVPVGASMVAPGGASGLPVGVQLTARAGDDDLLIGLAVRLERTHAARPE